MAKDLFHMLAMTFILTIISGNTNSSFVKTNRTINKGRIRTQADRMRQLENTLGVVSRQLMMQQFYVEEQTRSNGNSGLKRIRHGKHGTQPYHSASHVDNVIAAIHNHANFDRTIGMGEFVAVLNGVEFRTRHNDYSLAMKSKRSSEYGATEDIPFPPVPPEVMQNLLVKDQIAEMKAWFKAWAAQDHSVRDYRPYFKPVLCYLEGKWTNSDQNTIEESFDSDRHHLDAKSWLDLQEKIRFTSYSGTKDGLENYAYLPTTVFSLLNETIPVLAQWNFQILCHPLRKDLPFNRLKPVDDFKTRMTHGLSFTDYANSRAARFQLAQDDKDVWEDSRNFYSYLDDLMGEIPGADNYQGYLEDDLMGDKIFPYDSKKKDPLNVAYFHRTYRLKKAGAMGLRIRRRGFADENLFLAQNTQAKVAGLPINKCDKTGENCEEWYQRWSYAIPLEIIYMTPLSNWNPYGITHRGSAYSRYGKTIYDGPDGKRDGGEALHKAYNGTNSKVYYRTPLEFFEDEKDFDPADTTQDYTCVLDSAEKIRRVRATGHRIFLPEIVGIASLRQRYPIMPIHGEGDAVWKELEALKDMVTRPSKFKYMYEHETPVTMSPEGTCVNVNKMCSTEDGQSPSIASSATNNVDIEAKNVTQILHFMLQSANAEHGSHTHHFELTPEQTKTYLAGGDVDVVTDVEYGHQHELNVARLERGGRMADIARRCDGEMYCWDGHHRWLIQVTD